MHNTRAPFIWKYPLPLVLVALLLPAIFPRTASAQDGRREAASGVVEGTVICADGNVPARGARVALIRLSDLLSDESKRDAAPTPEAQATDFSGDYVFSPVAPGTYLIHVEQDGYADDLKLIRTVLKGFSPDERKKLLSTFPEVTTTGESTLRKDLIIYRAASISGHVSVDLGGSIPKSYVTATLVSSTLVGNLEGKNDPAESTFQVRGNVDDRGAFRITGLPSGKYRLSVVFSESYEAYSQLPNGKVEFHSTRVGNGRVTVFAPQAVVRAKAKLFELRDGEELTDADIIMPMSRLHSISGIATQNGAPVGSASIRIDQAGIPADPAEIPWGALTNPDGTFRIDFMPSASYLLSSKFYPYSGAKSTKEGKTPVVVGDTDVAGVNLEMHDALSTKPENKPILTTIPEK